MAALWLALPVLVIAAWMLASHGPKTQVGTAATSAAQPPEAMPHMAPESAGAPAQAAAAVSTAPAVSAAREVPARKAVAPLAPVEQATATLLLAVSPWGEVYVDGKRAGVSPPLATLQLEPGRHKVEIRNQAFSPYRDNVNLEPGTSLKIRHKFE